MKKTFLCLLALVMSSQVIVAQKSIVILYENDVHCGIDGYTKMAGLRDAIESQDTAYVGAVCCGDFLPRIRPMSVLSVVATSCRATPREPSPKASTLPIS